jgi:glutamate transport system permease protein
LTTLSLSLYSFFFAVIIGVVVAMFRVSPVPPLRIVGTAYVEIFRNTPLFAQLLIWGFGLTKIGIQFGFFTTAVIAMSLYAGSFVAETVRAGMLSIPQGQAEAARSLGLSFTQSAKDVILPQALRNVVAPIGSLFIANHKNTAIAQVLGVAELTFIADQVGIDSARPTQALIGTAICYLVITYPAGLLVGVLERKVAIKR